MMNKSNIAEIIPGISLHIRWARRSDTDGPVSTRFSGDIVANGVTICTLNHLVIYPINKGLEIGSMYRSMKSMHGDYRLYSHTWFPSPNNTNKTRKAFVERVIKAVNNFIEEQEVTNLNSKESE